MQIILQHNTRYLTLIQVLVILISISSGTNNAQLVFSEHFDISSDWLNKGSQRCKYMGWDDVANDDSCANMPQKFDLIYVTDKNPNSPMCEINSNAA